MSTGSTPTVAPPRAGSAGAPSGGRAQRVVVLGGTSEIAGALVQELARAGACEVALVGRHEAALSEAATRLQESGRVRAFTLPGLEAAEPASHRELVDRAFALLGGVEIVIVAVGMLGERGGLPRDLADAREVLQVNAVGCGSLAMESARALQQQGGGRMLVISSLAAERPRRANAVYGASKAALDALCQGLADDLRADGVVITVLRPGFVRTRMTRELPVPPFACSPATVARAAVRGMQRGAPTVWAPSSMRWVGMALRLMPRPLFRRLSL